MRDFRRFLIKQKSLSWEQLEDPVGIIVLSTFQIMLYIAPRIHRNGCFSMRTKVNLFAFNVFLQNLFDICITFRNDICVRGSVLSF